MPISINLLKAKFSDSMEIQPQINSAKLTHKSLINITKNYHGYVCDYEECVVYEKQMAPIKITIGPTVGVTTSNIKFGAGFYSDFNYKRNINGTYGIQLNTLLPRVSEKVSLQMEVLYNKNDYYGIYKEYYELYIKNALLQHSYAFKYNFPKGKVRPTFGGGVVFMNLLKAEISAVINNDPLSSPKEHYLDPQGIGLSQKLSGGFVQLGCNYHVFKNSIIFTNIKYSRSAGVISHPSGFMKTFISSFNFSAGLNF